MNYLIKIDRSTIKKTSRQYVSGKAQIYQTKVKDLGNNMWSEETYYGTSVDEQNNIINPILVTSSFICSPNKPKESLDIKFPTTTIEYFNPYSYEYQNTMVRCKYCEEEFYHTAMYCDDNFINICPICHCGFCCDLEYEQMTHEQLEFHTKTKNVVFVET